MTGDIDDPNAIELDWLQGDEDCCYLEMTTNSGDQIGLSIGRYAAQALNDKLEAYLKAWDESIT